MMQSKVQHLYGSKIENINRAVYISAALKRSRPIPHKAKLALFESTDQKGSKIKIFSLFLLKDSIPKNKNLFEIKCDFKKTFAPLRHVRSKWSGGSQSHR